MLRLTVGHVIRNRLKHKHGNPGDWHFTHDVQVGVDLKVSVKLRLCVPYRCQILEAWSCSLVMFNIKVDGIDYHVRADDGRGGICRGWHRHEWDPRKRKCDHLRNPLPDFNPGDTIEMFLENCCRVMKIDATDKGATQ